MFRPAHKVVFSLALCLGALSQAQAQPEESPGWEVGGSWIVTGQRLSGAETVEGSKKSQLNTRLDVELQRAFPAHHARFFSHFRVGSGSGLQVDAPLFTGAINTTAFAGSDNRLHDTKTVLGQAWMEVELVSVARGLSIVAGKIDPSVFFDQSSLAHDESVNFINNLFVHNPLLDSGGNYGIDENDFSPGGLVQYETRHEDQLNWSWALGAFGAGNGTTLDKSPSNPFLIAQVRAFGEFFPSREGSAAFYYWTNPEIENFVEGNPEKQSGYGFSGEQALTENLAVFSRLSYGLQGTRNFDRAVTGGAQYKGSCWGRPDDFISLAFARLRPGADAVASGAPTASEKTLELMYAYQLTEQWVMAADYQQIQSPGGDSSFPSIRLYGLRSTVKF